MTIVCCPRCGDEVTIPGGDNGDVHGDDTRVECPLCREQYTLADAREKLPPLLMLLDAAPSSGRPLIDLGGARNEAAFEFEEKAAPKSATVEFSPATAPERPAKNPLLEMLKVAAGGVAGLTIAYLIIWWGLGKDPFSLGPSVAVYAPWIVPTQFRGVGEEADDTDEQLPPAELQSMDASIFSNTLESGAFGSPDDFRSAVEDEKFDATPRPSASHPSANDPAEPSSENFPEPTSDDSARNKPSGPENGVKQAAAETPLKEKPASDRAKNDAANEKKAANNKPAPSTEPSDEPFEKAAEKKAPLEDKQAAMLNEALAHAREATAALVASQELEPPLRRTFTEEFNAAIAKLGAKLAGAAEEAHNSPEMIQARGGVDELLTALDAQQEGRRLLTADALRRIEAEPTPERRGVAIVGRVLSVSAHGRRLFLCHLEILADTPQPVIVELLSREKLPAAVKPGAEVLMLGALVDNPSKTLPGYRGKSKQVILIGRILPAKLKVAGPKA